MKRLLYLTLGYTLFEISKQKIKELLNSANMLNIQLLSVYSENEKIKVKIYSKDEKALFYELNSHGVEENVLKRKGIPHLFNRYRHRAGLIAGIGIFFLILVVSPLFIWEIKVKGNENVSREFIISALKKEGVSVGAFSPEIDRKQVCMNILRSNDEISWISVNFIGSSANVEVVERESTNASLNLADGANIIAVKDGQIIDADVIRGYPQIKKGDIVKKGQILVSGVFNTNIMGARFVYSKADIVASVFDEYKVEIPLKNTKRVYGEEEILECYLKIFGKSINIFKNYTIFNEKYDTITKEEKIPFLSFDTLPLSIETTYALPYENVSVILSAEEALKMAKREFWHRVFNEEDYIELISLEESYFVKDSVLIYMCGVEAAENIAATAEFNLD